MHRKQLLFVAVLLIHTANNSTCILRRGFCTCAINYSCMEGLSTGPGDLGKQLQYLALC